MRNPTYQFLIKKITEAITLLLQKKNIPPDKPLEHYIDDIFQLTLEKCASYFLTKGSLRGSERQTLLALQKDLIEQVDLTIIQKRLVDNLRTIKPVWGELFGTDRGPVYKTFWALNQWPCFTDDARLHYKQKSQLHMANVLIQSREKTTDALSERIALQFITIQKLQLELKAAKETSAQLEAQLRR